MSIEESILGIEKNLNNNVKLIAVSKTRNIDEMEHAYEVGVRDFGENKVQELINKTEKFHKDVRWHFIGHLQRNKVKYIVGKVDLIQSLDSVRLLNEIEKRYGKENLIANMLIEINIGREENKSGIYEEELQDLLQACEKCKNVKIKGLMCIIPKGTNEQCKHYFKKAKLIFDKLKEKSYQNISMDILSMGMSGDYKIAVEEGSNMVRVGQGIFGPRKYK
ncbi:YggS family pyridoxal phosphate-dependent enzyme [Haloimpatiens sp. FM7330]|uniref:YggS family pyridoxal phosphate-dependent enzyme n=1 Tax=Haloimpatiens sp. FM7330 TaxID=3298610 RepID=UPI00363E000E